MWCMVLLASFFSEKTGFNEEDLAVVKNSLLSLFANDASSARPEGSMEVKELFFGLLIQIS